MAWRLSIVAAALLALLSIYYPNLLGREHIETARLLKWANSTPVNNKECVVNQDTAACEDVKIHHPSNTAFLACGNPSGRSHWYPAAGAHNAAARSEESFRESLFKYDIKTGKTTQLQIEGLEGDFVTHGLDVFESPKSKSTVYIFTVRHAREGDSVSIFSHKLGSNVVKLVKDVKHPAIKTANAVAAVGELEFYVTNDHYFFGGPLRYLEETFGPFSWATHVQYCDASQKDVQCKQVTGTFPGANGLAISDGRMFVGDAQNGTVTIFKLRSDRGADLERQIELGAAADNIRIVPTTGDLIVAVFPTILDLPKYLANSDKLGKDLLVPGAALRLPKKNNYQPELFYFDNGEVLSFMTVMTYDPYNKIAIGGAVLQYGGFAVCKIPEATAKKLE
ncbi:paraoxonase 2 [Xylogone sp. PMI_703]|nr:paraoxonase 2 [Xylogone sp. PMI_703]